MNKIIFLDIDGVLNSRQHMLRVAGQNIHPDDFIDPNAVIRFNILVEKTNAKIVISSCWRIPFLENFEGMVDVLKRHKISGEIIGMTPHLMFVPGTKERSVRGDEIQKWMDDNKDKYPISEFIIIDDDSDMGHLWERLIKTSFEDGLQMSHVFEASKALGPLEGPAFIHDCDKCIFIGADHVCDYYYCNQGSLDMATVIARHSSDPGDYESGLFTARRLEELDGFGHDTGLVKALHLAREKGLVE